MISSFAAQLSMYVCIMLAGNVHLEVDDMRQTGLHVRTLIAVYQVLVVTCVLSIQSVFLFFIRVVKRDSTSFVLVEYEPNAVSESPRNDQQKDWTVQQWQEKQWQEKQELDRQGQTGFNTTEAEENNEHTEAQQSTKHESKCVSECNSAKTSRALAKEHKDDVDILSQDSELLRLNIVFDTSTNLDLYVLYVNFIGLVLWDTFVCFNFATYDSCFVIVCGMVVGWVCNSLSKECRCHEAQVSVVRGNKMFVLFYCGMFVLIVLLGGARWQPPEDLHTDEQLNLYLPAFFSGVFWTGISIDVAFTEIAQGSTSKGILYDARRALPTFLLVMCVSALYSSPDSRSSVLEYIGTLSRLATVHLLLIEPVLLFVSIYVMIIAFEKQRSTDFILAMVLVQGMCVVYRSETYDGIAIACIAACVLLLSVHVTRLLRS